MTSDCERFRGLKGWTIGCALNVVPEVVVMREEVEVVGDSGDLRRASLATRSSCAFFH
jgi:hypothetical protein